MQYPILKEAKDALDDLSSDPDVRERAAIREIELKLYEYGIANTRAEARAEGREEGRAEGREEKARQTLIRLLTHRFGELPSDVGSLIAVAPESDIDRWLERLLVAESVDAVFG